MECGFDPSGADMGAPDDTKTVYVMFLCLSNFVYGCDSYTKNLHGNLLNVCPISVHVFVSCLISGHPIVNSDMSALLWCSFSDRK